MRIRVVSAIHRGDRSSEQPSEERERQRADRAKSRKKLYGLCEETELDSVGIDRGPASIESRYDEIFAIPEIVKRVKEAEAEGVDACVVNCFGDPGENKTPPFVVRGPTKAIL